MGRSNNYTSLRKQLRSMKRMRDFLKSKLNLSQNIEPKLVKTILPCLTYTPESPNLNIVHNTTVSIKPRKIYHPAVINASIAMFKKHPDQLTQEEIIKFNHYKKFKAEMDDPLETNVVYLPLGGLRNCLVCGNLT